jgi:hypothetical protein
VKAITEGCAPLPIFQIGGVDARIALFEFADSAMRVVGAVVLAICLCALAAPPVMADKRVALLIGNSSDQNACVPIGTWDGKFCQMSGLSRNSSNEVQGRSLSSMRSRC